MLMPYLDVRRDTGEGLNRRTSCIHRTYSSTCARRAASGGRSPRHTRPERPEVGVDVKPGVTLVARQVCSDRQPQRVDARRQVISGPWRKFKEGRHLNTIELASRTPLVRHVSA